MENTNPTQLQEDKYDCLLVHVPKMLEYDPGLGWLTRVNFLAAGLLSLAEELIACGFRCRILHLGVEKMNNPEFILSDFVNKHQVPTVAFSLHWHPQTYDTVEAARQLKQDEPGVTILFGGYTASYFARQILETYPWVDAIIRGEGEKPLAAYLRSTKRDLSTIANLTWRDANGDVQENPIGYFAAKSDLDCWRFAGFDYLEHKDLYFKLDWRWPWNPSLQGKAACAQPTFYGFPLGRGCMGSCTWCGGSYRPVHQMTGRSFVSWRSPGEVEKTVKLCRNQGINRFYSCFDAPPAQTEPLIDIIRAIGNIQPPVSLSFESFHLPEREMIHAFKKLAPDSTLILSPETVREDLRQRHRGFPFTNGELEETLGILDSEKIQGSLYFTLGLPEETKEDIEATAHYQKSLRQKHPCIQKIYTFPLEMEPGAPWYENPESFGIRSYRQGIADFHEAHKQKELTLGYDTQHLSQTEIMNLYCRLFCPLTLERCMTFRQQLQTQQMDVSKFRRFGLDSAYG